MAPKIRCKWQNEKRLLVNPDGQAFPCCYLGNIYYQAEMTPHNQVKEGHREQNKHDLLKSYRENADKYNVFKTDVGNIVNGEWFTTTLPESWESEDTVHIQCERMCGE